MRPRLLFPLAFAISAGLAGLTGALVTPILSLGPTVGDPVLATSFLIVILLTFAVPTFMAIGGYATAIAGLRLGITDCLVLASGTMKTSLHAKYR